MKALKTLSTVGVFSLGLVVAPASQAATIFFEDFENPVNGQNWEVYQQFGQWSSAEGEAGIEIQRSGVVVDGQGGSNQYVELDSDTREDRGGVPGVTNSSMTRTLTNLASGAYLLDFYYQPRTENLHDNDINVYFDRDTDDLRTNLIYTASGARTDTTDWAQELAVFEVSSAGNYAVTFAAAGIQNTLGGFVDTITLRRLGPPGTRIDGTIPLPATAWLFLTAIGAGGLMRRIKARAEA